MIKRFFLFIPLLAALYACRTKSAESASVPLRKVEPTIGIGFLQASLNSDIPLYYDMESITPFDTIRFSVIPGGDSKGKFVMTTGDSTILKPYTFYAGDSEEEADSNINSGLVYFAPQLSFKVVGQGDNRWQIIINEKTCETAVVKNDGSRVLYTEGQPYWTMSHGSGPDDEPWFLYEPWEDYLMRMESVYFRGSDVYDFPEGNVITEFPYEYGEPVKVDGYWVKVRLYSYPDSAETVWLRWTDGEKFLVTGIPEVYF